MSEISSSGEKNSTAEKELKSKKVLTQLLDEEIERNSSLNEELIEMKTTKRRLMNLILNKNKRSKEFKSSSANLLFCIMKRIHKTFLEDVFNYIRIESQSKIENLNLCLFQEDCIENKMIEFNELKENKTSDPKYLFYSINHVLILQKILVFSYLKSNQYCENILTKNSQKKTLVSSLKSIFCWKIKEIKTEFLCNLIKFQDFHIYRVQKLTAMVQILDNHTNISKSMMYKNLIIHSLNEKKDQSDIVLDFKPGISILNCFFMLMKRKIQSEILLRVKNLDAKQRSLKKISEIPLRIYKKMIMERFKKNIFHDSKSKLRIMKLNYCLNFVNHRISYYAFDKIKRFFKSSNLEIPKSSITKKSKKLSKKYKEGKLFNHYKNSFKKLLWEKRILSFELYSVFQSKKEIKTHEKETETNKIFQDYQEISSQTENNEKKMINMEINTISIEELIVPYIQIHKETYEIEIKSHIENIDNLSLRVSEYEKIAKSKEKDSQNNFKLLEKSKNYIENLEQEKEEIIQELNSCISNINQLKNLNESLSSTLSIKENEICSYKEKCEDYEKEVKNLESIIKKFSDEKSSKKKEIEAYSKTKSRLKTLEKDFSIVSEKVKILEKENQSIRRLNQEITKESISIQKSYNDYKSHTENQNREKLTVSTKVYETKLIELKKEIEVKEKRIEKLTKKHFTDKEKIREFKEVFDESQREIRTLKSKDSECKMLKSENENMKREMEQLTSSLEYFKGEYDHLKSTKDSKILSDNSEVKELKNALSECNREKVNMMREATMINDNLIQSQAEAERLKELVKEYQMEIEEYQAQLEMYADIVQKLEMRIEAN